MPNIKFVYRTDVHVADRSPISWKGDYPAEIWENLDQVGEIAKKVGARAVLDGGDYFHVKASSKNPHHLVRQSADIQRGYPCKTYCVEGNHDIQFNNLDTLDRQPLGVLYATGVFEHLREEVFEDRNIRVRVVGLPYSPFRTREELQAIRKQKGDTHLIVVCHQLAGEEPPATVEDFFNEPVFRYSDLIVPNGPDVWCFGHWHKDQGVVTIGDRQFVNLGALSRGALVRENLERLPKVAVIDCDEGGAWVEAVPLNVLPAADVFDLERKASQEAERTQIDQWVERLVMDGGFDPNESIQDNIAKLAFAPEVRDLALHYLEGAEVG